MKADVIIVTLLMVATNVAEKWSDSRTLKIFATIAEGLVAICVFTRPLSKWILRWNRETVLASSLFRLDNYKDLIAEASRPFLFTGVYVSQIEDECRAAILVRDALENDEFEFVHTIILGLALLYKSSKLGTTWTLLFQRIRMWNLFRDSTVNRNNCVAEVLGLYDGTQPPRSLTAAQLGLNKSEIFFCMRTLRLYAVVAGQWVQVTTALAGSDIILLKKEQPPRCTLRYTIQMDPGTLFG